MFIFIIVFVVLRSGFPFICLNTERKKENYVVLPWTICFAKKNKQDQVFRRACSLDGKKSWSKWGQMKERSASKQLLMCFSQQATFSHFSCKIMCIPCIVTAFRHFVSLTFLLLSNGFVCLFIQDKQRLFLSHQNITLKLLFTWITLLAVCWPVLFFFFVVVVVVVFVNSMFALFVYA